MGDKPRELVPMEIFLKMRTLSKQYESKVRDLKKQISEADGDEKKRLDQELIRIEDEEKNAYKMVASKLVFKQDAMRNYAQNIIGRAKVVYEQVMSGQEIDFDKFCKYDGFFRGVSFDRAEWQKALQGSLVTPLRYLFEANGATQLNAMTRAPDEKGEWVDMTVGEAMMGHQILDIPTFRTLKTDVTPDEWKALKDQGYRTRGKWIIQPNGKYKINYDRVQNNKRTVWKQWMLMKLGGDLWQHVTRHSTDPAFDMHHYLQILEAIEKLPTALAGDEYDMQGVRITDTFFTHHQMQWLKRISGTTNMQLFNRQFWADIAQGDKRKKDPKFGESANIIISAIFKGY